MDIYETHILADSRIPFSFKHYRKQLQKPTPPNNWHENLEILYFTCGNTRVLYDDCTLEVQAGDLVIVNANCLHTVELHGNLEYDCLIIDRDFCLANDLDTSAHLFEPLIQDDELAAFLRRLREEYDRDDSPFRIPAIRGLLLQILTLLCRRYSQPNPCPPQKEKLLSCIRQAIGYIRSEYDRDLSLDDISARVGLSKYYFTREFRRITGYTFVSYINLVRCEQAKKLLTQSTLGVAEIGALCGFSGASYFTRTFRTYTGTLPAEYRNRH